MVTQPAPAENLRTVGRWSPLRQAPPQLDHAKSAPTIPSKYEVTLFKGDRERLGFGSKCLKLQHQLGEGAPGPGDYGNRKSFTQDCNERTSWGARGTGGFASRSVRFGARSVPVLPRPGRGVPGPGSYDQDCALHLRNPKDFNQASQTAVFARNFREKAVSSSVPGPGHYQSEARVLAREASAAQSAFRSCSRRTGGVPMNSEEVPGPGEYSAGQGSLQAATVPDGPNGEFSTTSNFKDPSRRRIVGVHRDLPSGDEQTRQALGDFADQVNRECLGTLGMAHRLPGPGHYDQDRDAMWEGRTVAASGSSCFAQGPQRTEWAPEDAGLIPGPGRYNPRKVILDRLTPATSAFNSVSERIKLQHPDAPGPAYYSPEMLRVRKSFWLNSTKQWAS